MLSQTLTLTAGATIEFHEVGDFLRVMSASGSLNVNYFRNGQIVTEAAGVTVGYAERFDMPFDKFTVYSAAGDTVKINVRLGNQVYLDSPPTGSITVANANGAATQGRASVTNADQTLIAANTARRWLLMQNNDSTSVLRVTVDGSAASATNGFRVQAGQTFEVPNFCVTGAIHAFMETASAETNNIEFVSA